MDIFGVGAAEIIVIGLLMLVIAGPKRSAIWAREAGRYLRQFREAWQNMMAELQKDMGEDGKELMNMAQEIGKTAADARRLVNPHAIVGTAISASEKMEQKSGEAASSAKPPSSERYGAWTLEHQEKDD